MPLDWKHPEFRFQSRRDWEQIGADASHMQLLCREVGTTIMLSIVGQGTPPDAQESAAKLLMQERRKAHLEAVTRVAPNGVAPLLQYERERLEPHRSGNGYEVVYEGIHPGRSTFGFVGYVTTRKIFGLFVETGISFVPNRWGMFREVVGGFVIELP
jgi:hypothetical protein